MPPCWRADGKPRSPVSVRAHGDGRQVDARWGAADCRVRFRSMGAMELTVDETDIAFTDRSTLSGSTTPSRPTCRSSCTRSRSLRAGRYYTFGELSAARSHRLRLYGTDGTTIRQETERGPYRVDDGDASFTLAVPRFQHPLVPQQRGAALGVAAGEHALPGVAAGSLRLPEPWSACRSRVAVGYAPGRWKQPPGAETDVLDSGELTNHGPRCSSRCL